MWVSKREFKKLQERVGQLEMRTKDVAWRTAVEYAPYGPQDWIPVNTVVKELLKREGLEVRRTFRREVVELVGKDKETQTGKDGSGG